MSLKTNMLKGWITSVIGVVTMGMTLYLIFNGTFTFVWEGVAGLSIGTVLLIAPTTIETAFIKILERFVPGSTPAKKTPDPDSDSGDLKPE